MNICISQGAINLVSNFIGSVRCAVLISPSVNRIYGNRLRQSINSPFFVYDDKSNYNFRGFDLVVGVGGESVLLAAASSGVDYAFVPTCLVGLNGFFPKFIVVDESVIYCMPKRLLASGIAKLIACGADISHLAMNVYKRQNIKELCNIMLSINPVSSCLAFDMARLIKHNIPFGRKLLRSTEFLYRETMENKLDDICNNIYFEEQTSKAELQLSQFFALKRKLEGVNIKKIVNN